MIVKFFLLAFLAYTGSVFHAVTAQPEICGNLKISLTDDETKFEIGVENTFYQTTTCTYTITGYAGGMIILQIDSLYLGRDAHYNDGYLKVAENQESLSTTDYVVTGRATDTFTVLGNVMVMEVKVARENYFYKCFVKAKFLQRPGMTQPAVCGPRFLEAESEAANLTVPMENETFTGPIVCQYFLRGINYRKLKITIEKFNLPQSENCEKDYMEISELIDDKWRRNKYCGGHLPPETYTSSKESLHVLLSARKYWQKVTVVATYSEETTTTTATTTAKSTTITTTTATTATTTTATATTAATTTVTTEPMSTTVPSRENNVTRGTTTTGQKGTPQTTTTGVHKDAAISERMNWVLLVVTLWFH